MQIVSLSLCVFIRHSLWFHTQRFTFVWYFAVKLLRFFSSVQYFFPSKLLLLWLLLSLTARFFSHSLANQKNRSHKQALIGVGICYHLSNRYIAYISTWISKKKIIRFPRISFRISIICTDSRQIKRNGSNYGARDKQANVISQFSLQTICLIVYTVSHCFHTKFLIIIHTLRMKCTGIFAFPCSRDEKSIHNIRCQRCVCVCVCWESPKMLNNYLLLIFSNGGQNTQIQAHWERERSNTKIMRELSIKAAKSQIQNVSLIN